MRMVAAAAALALALACTACGRTGAKSPAAPPEEVYRKYVAACLSADGKAQWALLSARLRLQSEEDLANIKGGPEEKIAAIAKQLDVTAAAVRAAGPLEFTTMIMRARTKSPAALARYRSLGPPQVFKEDNRLHVVATTPDDGFTWTMWFVEELDQWKVDQELEEITPLGVYRMFVEAYLAADGNAQWALLSGRQRKESETALAQIKGSDEQLDGLARKLGVSIGDIRAAGPAEFTTMVMKSRMRDPEAVERYRSLGLGRVTKEENRLRVAATTPNSRFTWTLWLVKEGTVWRVDEELEDLTDVIKPGEK